MIGNYYNLIRDINNFLKKDCKKLSIRIGEIRNPIDDVPFNRYYPVVKIGDLVSKRSVNINIYRCGKKITDEACDIIATVTFIMKAAIGVITGSNNIVSSVRSILEILTDDKLYYSIETIMVGCMTPEVELDGTKYCTPYRLLIQMVLFNMLIYKYRMKIPDNLPSKLKMLYMNTCINTLDYNTLFTQELSGVTKYMTNNSYNILHNINVGICNDYIAEYGQASSEKS